MRIRVGDFRELVRSVVAEAREADHRDDPRWKGHSDPTGALWNTGLVEADDAPVASCKRCRCAKKGEDVCPRCGHDHSEDEEE